MPSPSTYQPSLFDRPAYYDTLESDKQTRYDREQKNRSQDKTLVLEFFKCNRANGFTPIEVFEAINRNETLMLLTSVRRSITTLTAKGYLKKLDKQFQKKEKFKVNNYRWQYNDLIENKPS